MHTVQVVLCLLPVAMMWTKMQRWMFFIGVWLLSLYWIACQISGSLLFLTMVCLPARSGLVTTGKGNPQMFIWAVQHFITGLLMLCVAHRRWALNQSFALCLVNGTFYSAVMKCFRDSHRSLICIRMHHAGEEMLSVLSVYLNVF